MLDASTHAYMRTCLSCVRTAYVRAYMCVRAWVRACGSSACEPPLVSFHSVVSSSANVARFLLAIAHTESRSLSREADRLLARREHVAWEKECIVREGLNSLHRIEYTFNSHNDRYARNRALPHLFLPSN